MQHLLTELQRPERPQLTQLLQQTLLMLLPNSACLHVPCLLRLGLQPPAAGSCWLLHAWLLRHGECDRHNSAGAGAAEAC